MKAHQEKLGKCNQLGKKKEMGGVRGGNRDIPIFCKELQFLLKQQQIPFFYTKLQGT